jgi:outer membrane biosynthesis protein TonB
MALRLIIEDEEGATTIVPLGEEEVTIGREPGNTIQLTEQNVSRQHARLSQGPDGWVIEDLDSYNGVKVNGVLVEGSVTLNEGDVVQIGDYHLALSNNVEQTTLNIERPSQAANEPGRSMPSVDLPRVAADAALAAAPAFTPTVSTDEHLVGDRGEPRESGGGGKGLIIVFALLAVVGLGGLAFKMMNPGETPPATKGGPDPAKAAPAKTDDKPEKKPTPPPPDPVPQPATTAGEPPPTDEPPDPSAGETPPVDPPVKKNPVKKNPTPPTKGETKAKPEEPKGDPVAFLEDARKASLAGNATQAYELAKKSYEIDKNTAALNLMGVSACKMGDHNKAKSAFKKLDATRQKQLQAVCQDKGIILE